MVKLCGYNGQAMAIYAPTNKVNPIKTPGRLRPHLVLRLSLNAAKGIFIKASTTLPITIRIV